MGSGTKVKPITSIKAFDHSLACCGFQFEIGKDGKCVGFATGCIGKDGLKPNTAYRAKGGRLVEVA